MRTARTRWIRKHRELRFDIDRAMLFALALVIAEMASWIDRYA